MKTITKSTLEKKVHLCQRLGGTNEYRLVVGYKWIGPFYGKTKKDVIENEYEKLIRNYNLTKEGRL